MNQDLRVEMELSGIGTRKMARKLGMSRDNFKDLMGTKLSKRDRKRVREAIEELSPYDGDIDLEREDGSEKPKKRKTRGRRTKRHPDGARLSDHAGKVDELWG